MERALFILFFYFRSHQWCKLSGQKEKRDLKKEKIMSPSNARKGYLKTWDCWNGQSFQGLCPRTPQVGLTLEPPASRVNMLTHVSLQSMAIKLNLSWKTEVNKSAWIKPWHDIIYISETLDSQLMQIILQSLVMGWSGWTTPLGRIKVGWVYLLGVT